VSSTHQRYKGFKPFKMDPKFRVSIPTAWRPEAGASLYLLFSKEHGMPVVKVLSQEAYDHKVELVEKSDLTPAEKGKKLGKLAMLCREATLNEQGKLLVPKDLSELAGIAAEADVMLAGRGIHFEIWSKPNFDTKLALEMAEEEEDDLGIF
jgi:DNA-binding transcriptional regulator/RsmH inhibitor MraZ